MFEAGIVDPTKVTRSALQNAASIAALMLTTEAMITNIKDDDKEPGAPPRGPCGKSVGSSSSWSVVSGQLRSAHPSLQPALAGRLGRTRVRFPPPRTSSTTGN